MKQLEVNRFLEVVQEMPDIEAEQQIVLRKEQAAMELAMLNTELAKYGKDKKHPTVIEIGHAIQVVCADNVLLNARLKEVRERMSRLQWSEAVRAIFGVDGWAQCREWMAAQEVAAK
jgi:hypothetical protein